MESLVAGLGARLQARGWLLATAESCTGGLVAAALTEVAGSSMWFERGFVTYSNAAKIELLGVQEATLAQYGAVSEEVVREMAQGALAQSDADIGLAISGIAGPGGGSTAKPVGTVCFAWASKEGDHVSITQRLYGDRASVRSQAVEHALKGIFPFL